MHILSKHFNILVQRTQESQHSISNISTHIITQHHSKCMLNTLHKIDFLKNIFCSMLQARTALTVLHCYTQFTCVPPLLLAILFECTLKLECIRILITHHKNIVSLIPIILFPIEANDAQVIILLSLAHGLLLSPLNLQYHVPKLEGRYPNTTLNPLVDTSNY